MEWHFPNRVNDLVKVLQTNTAFGNRGASTLGQGCDGLTQRLDVYLLSETHGIKDQK